MQDDEYRKIYVPGHKLRTPAKKFIQFLVVGVLAAVGVIFFPSLAQQEFYFPYLDLDWLRPAAGILATIAVASIILDGPLQQAVLGHPRVEPACDINRTSSFDGSVQKNRWSRSSLKGSTRPKSFTQPQRIQSSMASHEPGALSANQAAFDFAEAQLKAGDYVVMGTGFLAALCANLAILEIVDRDSSPDYSLLPSVVFTTLAHIVIVGVCSIGLGYKNEKFLLQRYVWRSKIYQTKWADLWKIALPDTSASSPTSKKQTSSIAFAYGLIIFAVLLLPLSLSLEYANDAEGFPWLSKPSNFPLVTMLASALFMSSLLVFGNYANTSQIIEREVSIKKLQATGSPSFAGVVENKYTSIVTTIMMNSGYLLSIGLLFTLFGVISSFVAVALLIVNSLWLRRMRGIVIDFSKDDIWHGKFVSSTFNMGQRLHQDAITSLRRTETYLQNYSFAPRPTSNMTTLGN